MKRILIIGDPNPKYHPLSNLNPLLPLLNDYEVVCSIDHSDFLIIERFDLCLCYIDSWDIELTRNQTNNLKKYLANDGKLLIIHNGISLQTTEEIYDILKVQFTHHPQECDITIKFTENELVNQLPTFTIFDEPYHYQFETNVIPLAHYQYDGNELLAAWKHCEYHIIYLMPGHQQTSFEHPTYQQLIINCINHLLSIVSEA